MCLARALTTCTPCNTCDTTHATHATHATRPQERDTCKQLLAHSYFADFKEWYDKDHAKAMMNDRAEK